MAFKHLPSLWEGEFLLGGVEGERAAGILPSVSKGAEAHNA